eukprot:COSAG01_NODE_35981_length_524_cov_0.701176_2_plen_89_part_01
MCLRPEGTHCVPARYQVLSLSPVENSSTVLLVRVSIVRLYSTEYSLYHEHCAEGLGCGSPVHTHGCIHTHSLLGPTTPEHIARSADPSP